MWKREDKRSSVERLRDETEGVAILGSLVKRRSSGSLVVAIMVWEDSLGQGHELGTTTKQMGCLCFTESALGFIFFVSYLIVS